MSQIFEEEPEEQLAEAEEEEEEELEEAPSIEASLDEILAKRADVVEYEEEEESVLELSPEEHLESLSVRAVPKQANEFVCSNCHLVKHQSQLADPARQLCRDCV